MTQPNHAYSWRLRVFDWNTPWFWLLIFFRRRPYGLPWIEFWFGPPHKWARWWFHGWQWEREPDKSAGFSAPNEV